MYRASHSVQVLDVCNVQIISDHGPRDCALCEVRVKPGAHDSLSDSIWPGVLASLATGLEQASPGSAAAAGVPASGSTGSGVAGL